MLLLHGMKKTRYTHKVIINEFKTKYISLLSLCSTNIRLPNNKEYYSFMYSPFMLISKTSLCSCLIITLSARVFESFMQSPFMLSKTPLCICMITTLSTRIYFLILHVQPFYAKQYMLLKMTDEHILLLHVQLIYV